MKKLLLLSILLFTIFSCNKDDEVSSEDTQSLELVETNFKAILPNGIEIPENTVLKFGNAYGEYQINGSNSGRSSIQSQTSEYESNAVQTPLNGGFQLNYLYANDKPVMCTIADLQSNSNQYIADAESTAISMLMTHPLLISSFQENYNGIVQTLQGLNSFQTYVNDIEPLISQSIEQSISIDYTLVASYKPIVIELINTTSENIEVPQANGSLEFNVVERNNDIIKYSITNYFKRTLHLYPKTVNLDVNGFPVPNTLESVPDNDWPEIDGIQFPLMDIMTTEGFSLWSSIISLEFTDIYEKTSPEVEVNLEDADQLVLEIYGLGKLHKPFNELTDEELLKMSIVGIHGGYRDVIRPLIDLFLGVKSLKSSNNDQHFDFRYGNRKAPATELARLLAINFVQDPVEVDDFRDNIVNENYTALLMQFPKYSINQILGDGQSTGEKERYLNLIYNIYKNTTGQTQTSDSFRNAIKKGANQISGIKNANFVGQVVNIGETALDLTNALYAFTQSEFKEEFRANKVAETQVTLISPENNYTLEDNATNLFFEWDFDRGIHIGPITFELEITETLADNTLITHTFNTGTTKNYNFNVSDLSNHSTAFNWKIKVLTPQGTVLIESENWNFTTESSTNIYDGNVTLTTQQQVDDFGANNYTEITGDLLIHSSNITNLNSLNSINDIGGYLVVNNNSELTDLNGLSSVTIVGNYIYIWNNDTLTSLQGLESIVSIGGVLSISGNNALENLCDISQLIANGQITESEYYVSGNFHNPTFAQIQDNSLCYFTSGGVYSGNVSLNSQQEVDDFGANNYTGVTGDISIYNNITNLNALSTLTSIGGTLRISNADGLTNLSGLQNLTSVGNHLWIGNNDNLINLNGLSNIISLGGALLIGRDHYFNTPRPNPNLTNLCGVKQLIINGQVASNEYIVINNGYNPSYNNIQNTGSGGCEE